MKIPATQSRPPRQIDECGLYWLESKIRDSATKAEFEGYTINDADNLAKLYAEYRRLKRENEQLKRRLCG